MAGKNPSSRKPTPLDDNGSGVRDHGSDDDDPRDSRGNRSDDDNRSDNEDNDEGSDADGHNKKRCVVDFDIDDADWEDVADGGTLPGLGSTTHRSRNPNLPTNPLCKHRHRVVAGPNVRATEAKRRQGSTKRLEALAEDLNAWEVEREEPQTELVQREGVTHYGAFGCRYVVPADAFRMVLRWRVVGRGVGEQYHILQVKRMVAADPSMLEGFTKAEKKEMIKQVLAKRKSKARGTRANNLAAAADTRRTMERLMLEITNLAERVGMVGFAMFSWGHVHDKTVPVTIQSWGAMEFFPEVLKRDPTDISHLFELWTVSRERETILGVTKCAMNYESYILKLVRGKGVGLINWPDGVDFKCMSLQSAVGPLQTLLDSLKCGMTRWKTLTVAEKQQLTAQFEEMVANGEVKVKEKQPRKTKPTKAKKRAIIEEEGRDSGEDPKVTRKSSTRAEATEDDDDPKPPHKSSVGNEESDDEAQPPARKTVAKTKPPRKKVAALHKSAACVEDTDEDDEPAARKTGAKPKLPRTTAAREGESDDEAEPPVRKKSAKLKSKANAKRTAKLRGVTVQDKLRALVRKGREADDEVKRSRAGKATRTKRKQVEGDDPEVEGQGREKRRKKNGGEKRKRMEGGDTDTKRKRMKKRVSENDGDPIEHGNVPAQRPKSKPLFRTKTTAAPAPTDEGPTHDRPPDRTSSSPLPIAGASGASKTAVSDAGSTTTTHTGGQRPNTVRGSGKGRGPPGVKVW
ncbi:hypothetical protein K438DRAFT_1764942 [Mycena galopus ATCC 62051]|nr:hypothetical protein K438DRAFT_1764942 [Mycena galopus ATCC 62051]